MNTIIDYILARGGKPSLKTNLIVLSAIGIWAWFVYIFGLVLADVVSVPLDWYNQSVATAVSEQNKRNVIEVIQDSKQNLELYETLRKNKKRFQECLRKNEAIKDLGVPPIPCNEDIVPRKSTGAVSQPIQAETIPVAYIAPVSPPRVEVETYTTDVGVVLPIPYKGWRKTNLGLAKPFIQLQGATIDDRAWHLLSIYNIPKTFSIWKTAGKTYGIKYQVLICIAWADSDLGYALKSTNNIGNVGNNDRGNVVHYSTIYNGIFAIGKVLNNGYLRHKMSIGSLSKGGGGTRPYYATSDGNWNVNVLNCLNMIEGSGVWNEDSMFRL